MDPLSNLLLSVATPLISVVIVNYNRCADLRDALASIRRQDYREREVIVVDNASVDDSLAMLRSEFPEVKVIALAKNIGMDGYSVACRAAAGELIFQMDNDSLMPDPTVLSRVEEAFASLPDNVAILATRVDEFRRGRDEVEAARKKDQRAGLHPTGGFHSGGVGFRKRLMDRVGYYNEDVFLYGSELFVQAKALAAGYRIMFAPEILMLHCSSNVARSKRGFYFETRNRYWFMRFFGSTFQQWCHLPAILLHDFIYAARKCAWGVWGAALREGFGPLPASLGPKIRSSEPLFVAGVNNVGRTFSPFKLVRRVVGQFSAFRRVD